jgi:hypothetical protein
MDREQLKFIQRIVESAPKEVLTNDEIKDPNPSAVEKILEQRHTQRKDLFDFAIKLTWYCFDFLVCVVFFQIWAQLFFHRDLLTGYALQVLIVGVFGQIIAIVGIIAKSIWDDKPYSDHLGMDYLQRHKNDK